MSRASARDKKTSCNAPGMRSTVTDSPRLNALCAMMSTTSTVSARVSSSLHLVGGDDQLAAMGMRHAALGAIVIQRQLAGDAELRHPAARR